MAGFESYCDPIVHVGAVGDDLMVKVLNKAFFGAHVVNVQWQKLRG